MNDGLILKESSHLIDILYHTLSEAVRVKYRLSQDGYRRYYTNVLRIKLSRCLYDEGRRKKEEP